jgi:ATP-dependent Lon protease
MSGGDYSKSMNWFKNVINIPYGKYSSLTNLPSEGSCRRGTEPPEDNVGMCKSSIRNLLKDVYKKLDENIYGMDDVKQEIVEYVARKITNPFGKGEVLALCGIAGVGKTKIIKCLANALNLPFFQINCGGLNDVAVLTGHSETYVGSRPGKIVEILQNSSVMNPIIYLDEIDKISENKSAEINGILTHLLDEEQNNKFQDNYLSNITIDLSKVLFVISFNDESKIDDIVSDRMKIIYINTPSIQDKLKICQEKMIPEILKSMSFDKNIIIDIESDLIEYIIINKCDKEKGVRQLKKTLEKIINRLNYDILMTNDNDNLPSGYTFSRRGEEPPDNDNNFESINKGGSSYGIPCPKVLVKFADEFGIKVEIKENKSVVYKITKTYIDKIIKNNKEDTFKFLNLYS